MWFLTASLSPQLTRVDVRLEHGYGLDSQRHDGPQFSVQPRVWLGDGAVGLTATRTASSGALLSDTWVVQEVGPTLSLAPRFENGWRLLVEAGGAVGTATLSTSDLAHEQPDLDLGRVGSGHVALGVSTPGRWWSWSVRSEFLMFPTFEVPDTQPGITSPTPPSGVVAFTGLTFAFSPGWDRSQPGADEPVQRP